MITDLSTKLMQDFLQESAQVREALKKHSQEANNYSKFFE